jgi:hypothetical protein
MWQSSGKYVPRVDQLEQIAPALIEMAKEQGKVFS